MAAEARPLHARHGPLLLEHVKMDARPGCKPGPQRLHS